MGSKHKHKDKKRKRDNSSSDSSSDSEEERVHKEKHKKHKKDKKKKKDEKKDEKKLLKEAKKFLKQKLKDGDPSAEKADKELLDPDAEIQPIGSDAYFEKNPEFTAWLRDERRIFFNDLPSAEARQLFDEFVGEWNARKLSRKYYAGIDPGEARRSQHSWGIKGSRVEGVKLGMEAAMEEEREARMGAREMEQAERRRWKADQKLLIDEMLPKATGREAQVEKRMARREEAKARDASPDMQRLPGGGDIFGGDDSFAAAKAREAERQAWRNRKQGMKADLADARAREAREKEDDRMAQFRALASGGPISIPKRQP